MKNSLRKVFAACFLLILCLLLPLTVCAETAAASRVSTNVIAGFDQLGDSSTITTEYKLALVTLEKRFPEQLSVRLEGDGAFSAFR